MTCADPEIVFKDGGGLLFSITYLCELPPPPSEQRMYLMQVIIINELIYIYLLHYYRVNSFCDFKLSLVFLFTPSPTHARALHVTG